MQSYLAGKVLLNFSLRPFHMQLQVEPKQNTFPCF
uniref:RPOC2 n=1 Tax=Arundo donax TaxID=35708 RepID=A0A0A9AI06_ARUDO